MSFSYNEELVLESNPVAEQFLIQIDKSTILNTIKEIALKRVVIKELKEEFNGVCPLSEVNGEHIKNYFLITLNGIQLVWNHLKMEEPLLESFKTEPLYENVFAYLDELVDEINFSDLFKKELSQLK